MRGSTQQTVPVRVDRWLDLQRLHGNVTYQTGGSSARSAKQGDRLAAVGDQLSTGSRSGASLMVDTGIGFVNVFDNTQVRVRSLKYAPDNGRITQLEVMRGQVRLQLRRFNHRGSSLQIWTPAGVSAVRGTEFGINVKPDGKMGVATLSGSVATAAQGRTVLVPGGFQNLTVPGQPPSTAVPLRDSTAFTYRLERRIQNGIRSLRLVGLVDPVNDVLVGSTPQATDRKGNFSLVLPSVSTQKLLVTVITPLGRRQVHEIVITL